MKRSTFRILFYLNGSKKKKSGCCPIVCRITVDGGVASFSTGREAAPREWNAAKGAVSVRVAGAKEINRELDRIRERLHRHYNRLVENEGYITAELLKNELVGTTSENTGLLAAACAIKDEVLKGVGITHAPATCRGYVTSYKNLCEYVTGHLGVEDIAFTALDYAFIENYDFFLKVHKKQKGLTVNKHMIFLRKVVGQAVRKTIIRRDPFEGYRYAAKATSRRKWLSQQELQAIMSAHVSHTKTNQIRHMFIFSAFTGLSRADILQLKRSDIRTDASGRKEIRIERVKTGTECIVPLSDIPLRIIGMYEGKGMDDRVFPKGHENEVCDHIKRVAAEAGLSSDLTFHQGRHAFSTLCLSKGMGIETLSRILGHQSIQTTQIYAKITNTKIAEDMKNVAMLFENKTGNHLTNEVVKPVAKTAITLQSTKRSVTDGKSRGMRGYGETARKEPVGAKGGLNGERRGVSALPLPPVYAEL